MSSASTSLSKKKRIRSTVSTTTSSTGSSSSATDTAALSSQKQLVASAEQQQKEVVAVPSWIEELQHLSEQRIKPMVDRFLADPELELEARIGRFDDVGRTFHASVDKQYFDRLRTILRKSSTTWSQQQTSQLLVDWYFPNDIRRTATGKPNQPCITIEKQVLETLTLRCHDRPFDIRIQLSRERQLHLPPIATSINTIGGGTNSIQQQQQQLVDENYHLVRLKERDSFVPQQAVIQYDLTYVQSGISKEHAAGNTDSGVFEVEIEVVRPPPNTTESSQPPKIGDALLLSVVQLLGLWKGQAIAPLHLQVVHHHQQHQHQHQQQQQQQQQQQR
jgi:hypothetical protein